MYAITINKYGDASNFQIEKDIDLPKPKPNQILIKVHASSVNPIDLMKREGYGRAIFEKQRKILFPWILFSYCFSFCSWISPPAPGFAPAPGSCSCSSLSRFFKSVDLDFTASRQPRLKPSRQVRTAFIRGAQPPRAVTVSTVDLDFTQVGRGIQHRFQKHSLHYDGQPDDRKTGRPIK